LRKTAIVMDSTGYLTSDILEDYDIRIVSLNVTIGDETFPEVELTNKVFFDKLSKITGTSTTSQPSVGAFLEVFSALHSYGYEEIVSIHLSHKISGTFSTALMAKDLLPEVPIHVFDSGSSALGLGLLAWAAAEWAEQGLNAQEIIARLKLLKEKTELYFVVDTLEYLQRGGRIGGAAALFGTLLQIKPILYFNTEGTIDVFDKVRSKGRAWQRAFSELERALTLGTPHRIAVFHVGVPDEAQRIAEDLRQNLQGHDIRVFEAGPVIATHVGPGALALAFHPRP
jgi:DegV family protein with EDD domain